MTAGAVKMRIGEVHSLLRSDFPDIELSKIRYYEDKGLVRPERSRKGYRLYSERDVACLREAVRLAQEEFVPLRVVRLRLIEQGLLDDDPVASRREVARASAASVTAVVPPTPAAPTAAVSTPAPRTRMSVVPPVTSPVVSSDVERISSSQFMEMTGFEADVVNQLVAVGLLAPSDPSGSALFSSLDVRVALACAPLVERGADLRLLGALRRVVEREMGVVDDLTGALRRPRNMISDEDIRSMTAEVAAEVGVLRSVLHERAVRAIFD